MWKERKGLNRPRFLRSFLGAVDIVARSRVSFCLGVKEEEKKKQNRNESRKVSKSKKRTEETTREEKREEEMIGKRKKGVGRKGQTFF